MLIVHTRARGARSASSVNANVRSNRYVVNVGGSSERPIVLSVLPGSGRGDDGAFRRDLEPFVARGVRAEPG
jgi:hypothetical protein